MRAQGDFVAISDQDDVWMADKIETLVAHIGDHDICFSTHLRGRTPEDSHTVSPQYSLEALLFGGFAGHTMLLRRDFIRTEEYWIDHIHYDWSLALCAQLHRGIVRVDRPLNWHRQHEASACAVENRPSAAAPWARPHANPTPMAGPTTTACSRSPTGAPSTSISTTTPPHPQYRLAHRMCRSMLSSSPLALLRLCLICLRHRQTIYYHPNLHGLRGCIRGFFYPFIFAYGNVQYDLGKGEIIALPLPWSDFMSHLFAQS